MAKASSPVREGITRGVLFGILIFAPVYLLFYSPQQKNLVTKRARLAQVEGELRNARQVATTRDDLRRVTERLQKVLEFYEERLPSEEAIAGLLEELQSIITASGVTLERLEMMPKEPLSNYERLPFKIVVTGGYHDIGKAVNNIERGKRFMSVSRIGVEGEGIRPFTSELEVSTFRFLEAAT
ncbi:MAG: type 4a pilus biogenesis protein PilO [Candidatus Eisenbacteria bacterium]|jgi:type IV pilus assembly protein PilO|nr:type 4a pilus biogenesis protein PilO [Candidatus Eisenbacteria bacterium]